MNLGLYDLIYDECFQTVFVNKEDFSDCIVTKDENFQKEGYLNLGTFENFFEYLYENQAELFWEIFGSDYFSEDWGFLYYKGKVSKYFLHSLYEKFTGGFLDKNFQYFIEDKLAYLYEREKEYLINSYLDNLYSEVLTLEKVA